MLEVDFDDRQEEYTLKIPAHGTPKRNWQEGGYLLHSEANLIEYVRRNTDIPVSSVVMYDTMWTDIMLRIS